MRPLIVAIFLLALAPRSVGLDLFPGVDSKFWLDRGAHFHAALQRGDWAATYRTGHPGVTVMWLAGLGLGPAWVDRLTTRSEERLAAVPGVIAAYEAARRPFVVVNAAIVAVLCLLAWRLFGPGPALLGGLLLALDPFLVGHGQLVHLDALIAGLLCVALLAGLVRWTAGGGWPFLVLCGVASGLAFVTKAPSAFLVPAIPAIALLSRRPGRSWLAWQAIGRDLLAWGALAALAALLSWPALLTNPIGTGLETLAFVLDEGGQPHPLGNFFLGQLVPDPGPLFYPVALAFRLTPAALLGLAALAALRPARPLGSRAIALLALALGILAMMTLGAKKFDRYILPAVPLLDLLAGLGLWLAWWRLRDRARERESERASEPDGAHAQSGNGATARGLGGLLSLSRSLALSLSIAVLAAIAYPLLSVLPYPLAYYNPLLGGGPAAARVMLVGRGEGLDQVARYINSQPDGAEARVGIAHNWRDDLQPMLLGEADVPPRSRPWATYVVEYIPARQRNLQGPFIPATEPDHTVWINGIPYAQVYKVRGGS